MERTPMIALVTARPRPDLPTDVDLPILAERLDRDAEVRVVAWDDESVDWSVFDLALIRSTWDYPGRLVDFLAWADRCSAATRLANPVGVIRWNSDKTYLAALHDQGVPVVRTTYLAPGATPALPLDREFVVKPTVGVGSRNAGRYHPGEHDQALDHIHALHRTGATVMVQPYLRALDTAGERALVFIDGQFQHAIRKGPVLAPGARPGQPRDPHPGRHAWTPTADELAVARAALAAVPGGEPLLYGRVDLVTDDAGEPVVMELELIEPNLFLTTHRRSLDPMAAAIVRAATGACAPAG